MASDILPSSVPQVVRGAVPGPLHEMWIPIFCANCGADGGWIPEKAPRGLCFYLCPPCGEKWSPLVGTMLTSDEAFWQRVQQEQQEQYGRLLTGEEFAEELKQDTPLAKLARDKKE